jgi:hypothetical protein
MKYTLKHIKKNKKQYDRNYEKRRSFIKRIVRKLGVDFHNNYDLILNSIKDEDKVKWDLLIKEERRLFKKSVKILKDLGIYLFDPCTNMKCKNKCDFNNPDCTLKGNSDELYIN